MTTTCCRPFYKPKPNEDMTTALMTADRVIANHLDQTKSLDKAYVRASGEQAEEIFEQMEQEVSGAEVELEHALVEAVERLGNYFDFVSTLNTDDRLELDRRYTVARCLSVALVEIDQALTIVARMG